MPALLNAISTEPYVDCGGVEQVVDLVLVGDIHLDEESVDLGSLPASPVSALKSPITTVAPSAANRRAVARPMPLAPPVITATLPVSRWVRSIFVDCHVIPIRVSEASSSRPASVVSTSSA